MKTTLCFLFATASLATAAPVDEAEFQRLTTLIKPQAEENTWLEIPWQTDLWAARQQAATEGKPLFLWEMDGHPLGCV